MDIIQLTSKKYHNESNQESLQDQRVKDTISNNFIYKYFSLLQIDPKCEQMLIHVAVS